MNYRLKQIAVLGCILGMCLTGTVSIADAGSQAAIEKQLEMMREASRRWLDDLLPARRLVLLGERQGEYQGRVRAAKVAGRHPRPGERLTPTKCDLAFGHANLSRAKRIDLGTQGIKDLTRLLISREELIQSHAILLVQLLLRSDLKPCP